MVGTEQLRERKMTPERVGQRPDNNGNWAPGDNRGSHDHGRGSYRRRRERDGYSPMGRGPPEERNPQRKGGDPNGNGGPGENGDPPVEEEEDLPEGMGIQEEEMMILIQMMMGMKMDPHLHQTLPCLGESIVDPNMFMYCKDLQDCQARRGSLDNLEKQEEMVEMD